MRSLSIVLLFLGFVNSWPTRRQTEATSGGNGSIITTSSGEFTYINNFGGTWTSVPLDNSAQAQSFSPPISQSWNYQTDQLRGVNLGGWLVLEPFISPAMFEPFLNASTPAIDEWTLSESLGSNLSAVLTEHYDTFITEEDFAAIAGAGLNWIRLPVPFWMIETYTGEPFLEGVAWTYFLQALTWARKYGLRVNLDLHSLPGSQNGLNHSGRYGTIGFLNGPMGIANAQRTLNYIGVLTEFISQPDYAPLVPIFGIANEVWSFVVGDPSRNFYYTAYEMMRNITGVGEGRGPAMSIHDGFRGPDSWAGFLEGADRLQLDIHPYLAFESTPNADSMPRQIAKPCERWATSYNLTRSNFGVTIAGEWSLGLNDCGRFLNGVENGTRYEGSFSDESTQYYGSCSFFEDVDQWDDNFKRQLRQFALASMDSLQAWFFWTWKIGVSSTEGRVSSPAWSYQLGLQEGYIPTDPRDAVGACESLAAEYGFGAPSPAPYSLPASATGGGGAGSIAPTQRASYSAFPTAIHNAFSGGQTSETLAPSNLPTYTRTGALVLPTGSTGPASAASAAAADLYTPISGCSYPGGWDAVGLQPTAC